MGKVDTSDLMMIITWSMDMYVNYQTEMAHLNTYNPMDGNDNER